MLGKRNTLRNEVLALKRQVNMQKPETQYFRATGYLTNSTTNVTLHNFNVTDSLINATDFRDNITGDRWRNKYLIINFTAINSARCRLLVYSPRKAGNTFGLSGGATDFVVCLDPTAFWVMKDINFGKKQGTEDTTRTVRIPLSNLVTEYNSQNDIIERGEIRIAIVSKAYTAGDQVAELGYNLVYSNM